MAYRQGQSRYSFFANHKTIVTVCLTLLAALGIFFAINKLWYTTGQSAKGEMQQIVSKVGKLLLLPSDEEPTLATVKDKNQLVKQPIFAKAENNDKILVYAKNQKVIVYRPSLNKIVDAGPLILDKQGSPYVTSKIAILNGSGKEEPLAKLTATVVADFPNATIVQKDVAPRTFPKTIVIDVTGKNGTMNEQIADTLGVTAGQLPLGVSASNADFLIIIGQDYQVANP